VSAKEWKSRIAADSYRQLAVEKIQPDRETISNFEWSKPLSCFGSDVEDTPDTLKKICKWTGCRRLTNHQLGVKATAPNLWQLTLSESCEAPLNRSWLNDAVGSTAEMR